MKRLPVLCSAALLLLISGGISFAADDAADSRHTERFSMIVHPKLPPYVFKTESKDSNTITIQISGGPKNYRGQTFTAFVDDAARSGFGEVDVNFDGYQDFRVVTNRGNHANRDYAYWVFDPKAGVFKEAPDFDGISDVDEKQKLLSSSNRDSGHSMRIDYFRVHGGRPEIIRSEENDYAKSFRGIVPSTYDDLTSVVVTRIYMNGKLRRIFYTTKFDEE